MKEEFIKIWVKTGILRPRQKDIEKIKSMVELAEINANVAGKVPLDEDSATLIFREIYESLRQLGDACWWLEGYEPTNHEISMDILKGQDINEKTMLNFVDRFKRIRHDANYRGFKVSVQQAKEILDFWDKCGIDIIKIIRKKM